MLAPLPTAALSLLVVALAASSILVPPHASAQEAGSIPVTLRTLPALENVRFAIDGEVFHTDAAGVAQAAVAGPGDHVFTVTAHRVIEPGLRVDFSKWSDGASGSQRMISVAGPMEIVAGFNRSYIVRPSFSDAAGAALPASTMRSVTVVDDNGEMLSLPALTQGLRGPTAPRWERYPAGSQWVVASNVLASNGGLEEQNLTYEVDHVVAAGKEIEASSEPFQPSARSEWPIEVAGRVVEFGARDVVFGSSASPGIEVTYPDGDTVRLEGGASPTLLLPEGSYVARAGGGGIALSASFDVPGSATVETAVIGYLDIALVTLVLAGATAVLLLRRKGGAPGVAPVRAARAEEPPQVRSAAAPLEERMLGVPSGSSGERPSDGKETAARRSSAPPPPPAPRPRLKVYLHSGRCIEGVMEGKAPSSDSDVMIMTVSTVWDAGGQRVASTPIDSFLLASQIARIDELGDDVEVKRTATREPDLSLAEGAPEQSASASNGNATKDSHSVP
ncbi:MAG: hypothetical protein ABR529_04165 [Actinomycetota bacterium]